MLTTTKPIVDIIRQCFSCRTYLEQPISAKKQQELATFSDNLHNGPFGSHPRFNLVAANKEDSRALRGLGTMALSRARQVSLSAPWMKGREISRTMAT